MTLTRRSGGNGCGCTSVSSGGRDGAGRFIERLATTFQRRGNPDDPENRRYQAQWTLADSEPRTLLASIATSLPLAPDRRELQSFALIVSGNDRRVSLREFLREGEVRDLKTGVPARGSWVRIPPSPPALLAGRARFRSHYARSALGVLASSDEAKSRKAREQQPRRSRNGHCRRRERCSIVVTR